MTTSPTVSSSVLPELVDQIETVIFGKREVIELAVVGFLAGGHILLEDVPGTGKTSLARALARSIGGSFQRVQFTSDLLPTDVLGLNLWSAREDAFRFTEGPIFHNVVLADELNRTSPRTQSSLLEAMSEGSVSIDGTTYPLPQPFFVIATQNPMEFEGTYPLPESQLDRFLVRLSLGYPDREAERQVLAHADLSEKIPGLDAVAPLPAFEALRRAVSRVRFDDKLVEYLLDLIAATRESSQLALGASTRAARDLHRAAQAYALVQRRTYVVPDDVKRLFRPVIEHRVIPVPGQDAADGPGRALDQILRQRAVPE